MPPPLSSPSISSKNPEFTTDFYIPPELMDEILNHLPLKSLFKFKSTSKYLSSSIQAIASKRIEEKTDWLATKCLHVIHNDPRHNDVRHVLDRLGFTQSDQSSDYWVKFIFYSHLYNYNLRISATIKSCVKEDADLSDCWDHIHLLSNVVDAMLILTRKACGIGFCSLSN